MLSVPDALSVLLRALTLVFVLQAAGVAIFLAMFGCELASSLTAVCRLGRACAAAGALCLIGHLALQAGRMAGDLSGMLDGSLLRLAVTSTVGVSAALGALGLAFVAGGLRARRAGSRKEWSTSVAVIGAALITVSFTLTGHTSVSPHRWLLCGLLVTHLLIVAFWFGALPALYIASLQESPTRAARIVDRFSRVATWLVPGILLAGLALAALLVANPSVLLEPYGELLLAKLGGFALLMGLASFNKWRLAPALARCDAGALLAFRRSLTAEVVLIVAVLAVTASLTTLFSPE